jgi:hypothetical protein
VVSELECAIRRSGSRASQRRTLALRPYSCSRALALRDNRTYCYRTQHGGGDAVERSHGTGGRMAAAGKHRASPRHPQPPVHLFLRRGGQPIRVAPFVRATVYMEAGAWVLPARFRVCACAFRNADCGRPLGPDRRLCAARRRRGADRRRSATGCSGTSHRPRPLPASLMSSGGADVACCGSGVTFSDRRSDDW